MAMTGRDIHLCGSIPLDDAAAVFETVAAKLGGAVRRVPDGETGARRSWLGWQRASFAEHPQFEEIPSAGDPRNATAFLETASGERIDIRHTTWYRLRPGATAETLSFPPIGYARNAIASYAVFKARKEAGAFAPETRFLVAAPSPFNLINQWIAPEDRIRVEPALEARMLEEVEEAASAIPKDELAWQWDVAQDMQAWDGGRQTYFEPAHDGIVERLVRIGECVPAGVELGYHFCYGSFGGRHLIEPESTASMVELANRLAAGISRRIDWVHMPVPADRDDAAYFAPLAGLALKPETRLYLGLIHDGDGADGTRRRMQAADRFVRDYGIATECGFGRRPAASIAALLDLHAELAAGSGRGTADR